MTQQLQRKSERHLDERRLDPKASDNNPESVTRETRELSEPIRSPGTTSCPDRVEASTRSGRPGWMKRLQQQLRRGFVRHQKPAKKVQATPVTPGVSRALRRHAREIEWCLREAGAETMLSSGTLSLDTRIGDGFSAAYIYIIAADNRIERMETLDDFDYEQSFAELLPDDAELILVVPYSASSKREAALYEVQEESRRDLWHEAAIATR